MLDSVYRILSKSDNLSGLIAIAVFCYIFAMVCWRGYIEDKSRILIYFGVLLAVLTLGSSVIGIWVKCRMCYPDFSSSMLILNTLGWTAAFILGLGMITSSLGEVINSSEYEM